MSRPRESYDVYDPTDLAGREHARQEAEAAARARRETEIADAKWLMSTRRGRRIMWRLLEMTRPFRMSFDTNAMKMAFNEGNRSLGTRLWTELMELVPELIPVMTKEHNHDRDGNGTQSN